MCPLFHSIWCENCFCGLILPVVKFSLITDLYVETSQHSSVSPMICNTHALTVLLWLKHPSLNDYLQSPEAARLPNIPADKGYSERNKLKIDGFNLEELNREEEMRETQTGTKVLNDLMIPDATSINQ